MVGNWCIDCDCSTLACECCYVALRSFLRGSSANFVSNIRYHSMKILETFVDGCFAVGDAALDVSEKLFKYMYIATLVMVPVAILAACIHAFKILFVY